MKICHLIQGETCANSSSEIISKSSSEPADFLRGLTSTSASEIQTNTKNSKDCAIITRFIKEILTKEKINCKENLKNISKFTSKHNRTLGRSGHQRRSKFVLIIFILILKFSQFLTKIGLKI